MSRASLPVLAVCLAASSLWGASASKEPAPPSTPAQAKALLDKAVHEVERVGEIEALAEFNDTKGPFRKGDLYVFCFGPDNKVTAHPTIELGTDVTTVKDADGKEIGMELSAAGRKGEGQVEYRWLNPATGKVQTKVTFVKRASAQVCGVGAYK